MKELIAAFGGQLEQALEIGQNYSFITGPEAPAHIVLTGLGGSGIGGSIVQNYVADKLKVPFVVNKDYGLPAFVSSASLVIVCSYSGNTEETIAAMKQALKVKAKIVCITSGGQIAELARRKNLDCILLPGGMPPRSCVGYSIVEILFVLKHFGLLRTRFVQEIQASIALLQREEKAIQKKAQSLASKLKDKRLIIYAAQNFEGLAIRIRQQINENSKMLAWHGAIPEMNHNELVGWCEKNDNLAVLLIRNEDDFERVQTRMEINKKIIRKYTPHVIELYSKGESYWERLFYFIHLTDWLSVYLADERGVDAMEVKVIDHLKASLAKV
ncbi:MAG: bifunctional phosphoglucose/phosphomannose isomerase [Bacteroidetes bacterium]|nr:bifunctional phosphoglucose/phosphomannose isomerase [Bacteroidota bacterium]MBS1629696.1 bifunctional phosphoglucose/phosphomannose isomerase [Bacteroidota bacterium]